MKYITVFNEEKVDLYNVTNTEVKVTQGGGSQSAEMQIHIPMKNATIQKHD